MNEYLREIVSITDNLATTGELVVDRNLVMYTLTELGEEYELFIQYVTTREKEVSYVKLQTML